jgi:hypothetical protein
MIISWVSSSSQSCLRLPIVWQKAAVLGWFFALAISGVMEKTLYAIKLGEYICSGRSKMSVEKLNEGFSMP